MTEQNVLARLSALEKSNRRLKTLLGMFAIGLCAAFFIGAAQRTPEVSAESFRLVDADGRVRAMLGSDKEGTFLFLNDETGKMRTSLAAQKTGTYVNFKDPEGKTRAVLSFDDQGPGLRIKDAAGNAIATLSSDNDGPFLQFRDVSGKFRTIAPMSDAITDPKKE